MTGLNPTQYNYLLHPVDKKRVGKNPKGHAHMEAWDIRRQLTRIFGFGGWDQEILTCDLIQQIDIPPRDATGKFRYTCAYRVTLRLTVRTPDGARLAVFEDGAVGDSTNQPSLGDCHDNAMKTALSQALKRCAINLGDQFGLSLYGDGTDAVVVRTLAPPTEWTEAQAAPPVVIPTAEVKPEPGSADIHQEPPGPPVPPAVPMVTEKQHKTMHALWREIGYDGDVNRDQRLQIIGKVLGLPPFESSKQLSEEQADIVIAKIREVKAKGVVK